MTGRLPLTVIGGFLGAGKTTLLNRWLHDAGGRRIAVLVNDFGALNIDAALVVRSGAHTIALSNGCACCSIGDDLGAALTRVIEARPRFDAVVIEASGVSDPWRIAQVGLADPALALQAVLVLVDASAVLDQAADPLLADSLARQLRAADLVVVNKTDLVDAAALARVHRWLDGLVPSRPRVDVQEADVPAVLRDGPRLPLAAAMPNPTSQGHDHGTQFETWSARPGKTFSSTALRAALRSMPAGVLRLKGWLRTDAMGWAEWQYAGHHGSLRRMAEPPADGAAVVAIGLRGRLPQPALIDLLAGAALPEPPDPPPA
jgi:G3E family GTPase